MELFDTITLQLLILAMSDGIPILIFHACEEEKLYLVYGLGFGV